MSKLDPMRRITTISKAEGATPGYQVKIYPPNSNSRGYYSRFFNGLTNESRQEAMAHRDLMEKELGLDPSEFGKARPREKHAGSDFTGVQVRIEDREDRLYAYAVAVFNFRDAASGKPRKRWKGYSIPKLGYERAYALAVKRRCEWAGFSLPSQLEIPPLRDDQLDLLKRKGCDMEFISQPYHPDWID